MNAPPTTRFLELRDELISERSGDGAAGVGEALTHTLDEAIVALAADVADEPLTVVAVGGYGRGDLCLRSDVDVMLLHDGADLDRITNAVLYPLWDANLRVGHSVRTVGEAITTARTSFETLTSLLTMRCLAGDASLWKELEHDLAELVAGRPFSARLAASELERRRRHPYPVMAADIKSGRGALRTHHGFLWERRRAELLGLADPYPPDADETAARLDLLAVRNALHAVAGREMDLFVTDLRPPAAEWLGVPVEDLADRVGSALCTGDRLAERRWGDLVAGRDPMVAFGRRVFGRVTSRFRDTAAPAPDASPLALALQAAARPDGVRLDTVERERIMAAVAHGSGAEWTPADRAGLVRLLSAGDRGRAAWDLLDQLGWVATFLPEWGTVATLPQLAPFHEHPVGAHLWRTVDEMRMLSSGDGERDAEYADLADEIGSTEELLLAAFLHDIGKGTGEDHSIAGARIVEAFCARTGFGPATTALLVTTTRHHLLLSHTATRRDPSDPAVIDDVADAVGDLRTLQVLYLLTVADARATGPTMWSASKATWLRSLYLRVASRFERNQPERADRIEAAVAVGERTFPHRIVEEHLEAMPTEYVLGEEPDDIAWHLGVLERARVGGGAVPVRVAVRPGDGVDEVLVVGPDQPGFLGAVASTFAVHGVAVNAARLFTRGDGTALDVFHVTDDRLGGSVPTGRWDAVEGDLAAVTAGERDLSADLERRSLAYRHEGPEISTRVTIRPHASARATVVEVRCADRIGRLAEIVAALYAEDLDIWRATLDIRTGEVIDTFHVRRHGQTLRDQDEIVDVVNRLELALG